MPSFDSVIEEVQLLADIQDKETAANSIYKVLFDYYTSADVINDYEQAVQQLDKTSVMENYKWLLFSGFPVVTDSTFYNYERRDKLCNFWLPTYQSIVKQLLSIETNATEVEHNDHLPLNAIKYLITNLIQMQKTSESVRHYIKAETQFQNFRQKDEYFQIIKLVLPLLINSNFTDRLGNDDYTKVKSELQPNVPLNTLNVTPTFILWIILKLILMFIKTDRDCLTMIKHDEDIKNILFKLIKLVKDNNPVKLSVYVSVAFLLNEDNIKNEFNDRKDIILALTTNINKYAESDTEPPKSLRKDSDIKDEDFGLVINGVYIIDILLALKAFLQYDQVKNDFIQNNGLQLLLDYFSGTSESSATNLFNSDDIVAELKSESKLKSEEEIEAAKKFFTEFTENVNNDISDLIKEGRILALECFFTMSFNKETVEVLKKNEEFITELRKLDAETSTASVTNERLKKAVDGLLWKLEKEDEFKKQQQQTGTTKQKEEFDLMISYSSSDKLSVHDIYKYLTENSNYRIWFDENETTGSLSQGMAQAVEKSKFILICMSETYKGSESCRNQAEYARDRKKIIIPFMIKQVECDGWLELISAGKIYIDFTTQDFPKALSLLNLEIERNQPEKEEYIQPVIRKERSSTITAYVSVPERTTTAIVSVRKRTTPSVPMTTKFLVRSSVISNTYRKLPIELWSEQDVKNFLYDNKLDVMILLTENMNGEELDQLFQICQTEQDRWIMFDRLCKELENRYQQILPISVYLRFLNQTQKYTNVASF